ncbi:MAG: TrkH family potassium uptake protein [Planctomycetota bacterium]|nr:TrkH family potassium uptake protein [Planctomycetota bacterium]
MRLSLVLGVIGNLLLLFAPAFLPPLGLAFLQGHYESAGWFAIALAISAAVGWGLGRLYHGAPLLWRGEALAIVAGTWLVVGVFSSIPYMFYGLGPVDAVFEAISGLTTTGATVLTDFGAYDDAFFLWRAMTQWFGGLGVIALFVVVLPRLGIAGRQLFFAEASISTGEGISPQIRDAARKLWILYIGLTAVLAVLLMLAGFDLYNGIVHALTTMSAGGFSPNGRSIEGFANAHAEWILVVFMVLSGTSFPLQWRFFSGRLTAFFRDGEFVFYLVFMAACAVIISVLLPGGITGGGNLRASAFQVASLTSSTGYASVDYQVEWSYAAKAMLVVVMLVGGCAGSACGGPKVIRYILTLKFLRRELTQVLHPTAVLPLRYQRRKVSDPIIRAVVTLVIIYLAGYGVLGLLLIVVEPDLDFTVGLSASLACFGNIGPAFGDAGPMGSYALFSPLGKVLLTLSMWLGRLEIVTVLALLHPHVWRYTSLGRPRSGRSASGERTER